MRLLRGALLVLVLLVGCGTAASAKTYAAVTTHGRVVGVTDGDTLTVLVGRKPTKVRLTEIDAPEHDQPWGNRSKQMLSSLVFARDVTLRARGVDRYGRMLARVFVGRTDVNAEMVKTGSAWAYREYLTDQSILVLEAAARRGRLGLWSLPKAEIEAPWAWRHTPVPTNAHALESRFTRSPSKTFVVCGTKTVCRQMDSCREAKFFLGSCGVSSLDRDRDGIPCESICGGAR